MPRDNKKIVIVLCLVFTLQLYFSHQLIGVSACPSHSTGDDENSSHPHSHPHSSKLKTLEEQEEIEDVEVTTKKHFGDLKSRTKTKTKHHEHDTVNSDMNSGIDNAMKAAKTAKRLKEADLKDSLENWTSPNLPFLIKNFPYHLTGHDDEGRPIFWAQLGRMDLRTIVENGGQLLADFHKYTEQAAYRVMKSIRNSSSPEARVNEALFLLDADGMALRQVTYLPNLQLIVKLAFRYADLIIGHLGPTMIVNTNFLAETIIRLIKPAFGPAMSRIEVYGTRKRKWIPEARRLFGAERIPKEYGGSKNYKPIAIYG